MAKSNCAKVLAFSHMASAGRPRVPLYVQLNDLHGILLEMMMMRRMRMRMRMRMMMMMMVLLLKPLSIDWPTAAANIPTVTFITQAGSTPVNLKGLLDSLVRVLRRV